MSLPVSGMEYKFIPRIAFIAQAIQDEKLWFIFGEKYGCGGPIQFKPGRRAPDNNGWVWEINGKTFPLKDEKLAEVIIVIREFRKNDLNTIMQIWCDTNIQTHNFISKEFWTDNYEMVEEILPQAEVYVYEDDCDHRIEGFIGLTDDYIAGIFVRNGAQSKGIGKQLLDYVKNIKSGLSLSVYQKNVRAISFYQREHFVIQSENIDDDTAEKEFVMAWNRQANMDHAICGLDCGECG